MDDRDYLLQIKIKNGPLMRLMRSKGIENGLQLSRETGIAPCTVGKLLNLKMSGLNKNGEWRKPVMTMANFFSVGPEHIFPQHHIEIPLMKNTIEGEVSLSEMFHLTEITSTQSPEMDMLDEERSANVSELLAILPSRERTVLQDIYGINGKSYTLKETADRYAVSSSRIQQIRNKALARLTRRTIIDGKEITDY